ncbi:MAG TPA: calcium-binding protein, partial [Ramlibacter sp.]
SGEIGDDRLDGGGGADELVGGEESDTYVIRDARARVIEAAEYGRDTVESHLATYTLGRNVEDGVVKLAGGGRLQGNSGSNGLAGSVGADTLLGGKGNDRLDGGAGSDSMEGGIGNDTYYIDDAGDRTVEAIASGTDTIVSTISRKLGAHLENLTLSGSASLKGSGNELDNVLRGNDGANVLDGGSGDDRIFGGLGNDTYVLDSAEDRILEEADSGVDTVVSGVNRALGDHQENLTLSGTASRGKGNDLSNVLQGNGGANRLDGGAGDDTLRGGNGDDTYYTDTVGDLIVEALTGGIDTVISTVAGVTLARYVENLTLLADAWFGTGNDQANVLRGTAHANRLDGGRGADTLEGGAGDDTYGVDNARDRVVESANGGRDTVVAVVDFRLGAHIETLVLGGSAAIDGTGNSGANRLRGNAAANVLDGGLGVDTMEGGRGDDTYHVDRTRDEVVEEPGGGHDTVVSTVDYTLGLDVDNLSLAGAALVGRGNEDANVLRGTAAANTLDGDQGADTLIGGAGDDRYRVDDVGDVVQELKGAIGGIDTVVSESRSYTMDAYIENLVQSGFGVEAIGNALANHMTGSASDNILDGGLGADTLVGGEGSDTYVIDSQDVVVEGKSARGQDTIITDLDWTLSAVMENLQLVGTGGLSGTGNGQANLIRGNAGANVLDGLGGADTLEGGQGNDTYYVEGDADFVREVAQGGIDVVIARGNFWLGQHVENLTLIDSSRSSAEGFGNELDNVLTGGAGGNWLDGYEGDDTIAGGAGADYVWGEGGHDRLLGGDGADRLVGGAGKDKLSGGAGSDRFVYDSVSNSPNGASDVITDFVSGVDKLDFRTQNSHDGEPSLESIAFIGSRGFDGDASGQLRYAYDAASRSVMLYGSDDADSHAEFAVQLLGISSLNESDFLFPVH